MNDAAKHDRVGVPTDDLVHLATDGNRGALKKGHRMVTGGSDEAFRLIATSSVGGLIASDDTDVTVIPEISLASPTVILASPAR